MILSLAVKILQKALRQDPDFFRVYKDNIAMSFKDEYLSVIHSDSLDIHKLSNNAATRFLNLLAFGKYTKENLHK